MGMSIGIPNDIVEDFVHETYLRLNKYVENPEKIMYNETEVNRFYVYITLKNLWTDYCKERSKFQKRNVADYSADHYSFEVPEWAIYEEVNREEQKAEEYIIAKINEEVDSWDHWYDKKLFRLYYNSDISMRKLAIETKISVTSIFNSCKNYKEILRTKFGEDFEDYLNGDFDKINDYE
jgi:DNA-directed RNA polymerase specialized sigma24 family protein